MPRSSCQELPGPPLQLLFHRTPHRRAGSSTPSASAIAVLVPVSLAVAAARRAAGPGAAPPEGARKLTAARSSHAAPLVLLLLTRAASHQSLMAAGHLTPRVGLLLGPHALRPLLLPLPLPPLAPQLRQGPIVSLPYGSLLLGRRWPGRARRLVSLQLAVQLLQAGLHAGQLRLQHHRVG